MKYTDKEIYDELYKIRAKITDDKDIGFFPYKVNSEILAQLLRERDEARSELLIMTDNYNFEHMLRLAQVKAVEIKEAQRRSYFLRLFNFIKRKKK